MTDQVNAPPVDEGLLKILRCPVAVHYTEKGDDPGRLELIQRPNGDWWLRCGDSGYKYPVRDGIPVMLVDHGEKFKDVAVEDLPTLADYFES